MYRSSTIAIWVRVCTLGLLLCQAAPRGSGSEISMWQTNWIERSITNEVVVTMPLNRFIVEFHTNWIRRLWTNSIPIYVTNWDVVTVTNTRVAEAYRTNVNIVTVTNFVDVEAYRTNWTIKNITNTIVREAGMTNVVDAVRTNIVQRTRTNWSTVMLTREVPVAALQTNYVTHYQTNARILSLTNWQTVVVLKTNWVTEASTNQVDVDVVSNRIAAAQVAAPTARAQQDPVEYRQPAAAATFTDSLVLSATRNERLSANSQADVLLTVRWTGDGAASFRVQQWRVEREDGAVLSFSQNQEFEKELPLGKYAVVVKGLRDSGGALLAARGTLEVTSHGVIFQQTLAAAR